MSLWSTKEGHFAPFWPPYTSQICDRSSAHTLFGQFRGSNLGSPRGTRRYLGPSLYQLRCLRV